MPLTSMHFETTHWSLVLAAGGGDRSTARAALGMLCETYWYPIYAYVRRDGKSADAARDLTQSFLVSLLERNDFADLREERGRFRAFLLASLRHFLANEGVRRRALKRGGGRTEFSLSFDDAERRYLVEPRDPATPERLYERRWALAVIDRVLAALREEWQQKGRAAGFDELKQCLLGVEPAGGYAGVADRLGMSEGAVKVAVHRLRRDFQQRLRRDIGETVDDPSDVDGEIRYLIRALDP